MLDSKEKIKIKSKAETLQELLPLLEKSEILDLLRFRVDFFNDSPSEVVNEILSKFKNYSRLIVRSSSVLEDNDIQSGAGAFLSVSDVKCDFDSVCSAVKKVIASYPKPENDEVFVQPMLKNVDMCGVVFTSDSDTFSPYYIINYSNDGSTDSVTSGKSLETKTVVIFKDVDYDKDRNIKKITDACKEIEELTEEGKLDIEFAISDNSLYILQVRRLVAAAKEDLSHINLKDSLRKIHKKIKKLNTKHPDLLGYKTIFGVMPDWNPAEIVGLRPKMLSLSLYKELVTDEIWAYQRDNYGYRNLRSHPLLVSFLGVPFIDARVSFNSFIPQTLDENTAEKLADYYLGSLEADKKLHDKVEFEIVFSCYYLGLNEKLKILTEHGFTLAEIDKIQNSLLELTNNIINSESGLFQKDIERIEILKNKYESIENSSLSIVDKIYWHIEHCKRYGTLPFAGIARAAFIAMQFLNSFVDSGLISETEKSIFLKSLNTVAKQMTNNIAGGDKQSFLEKYGHLRPGTYDILSKRYDENYDRYFDCYLDSEHCFETFEFNEQFYKKLDKILEEEGILSSARNLVKFIKDAVEAREYSKLVFTKSVSRILQLIEIFGRRVDLPSSELAHLNINIVKNMYSSLNHQDVKDIFLADININKEAYRYTRAVKLPEIIADENDIYCFELLENQPNFVTLSKVQGEIVNENHIPENNLNGKIILISSADPGYDYLFTKGIAGLITCYGGANSHMAIRCSELGLPAAIGCGENLYSIYSKAKILEIDAENKIIRVIN